MSDINREIAERTWVKLHPINPLLPYQRQSRLSDLWPRDQKEFIRQVEAALKAIEND